MATLSTLCTQHTTYNYRFVKHITYSVYTYILDACILEKNIDIQPDRMLASRPLADGFALFG